MLTHMCIQLHKYIAYADPELQIQTWIVMYRQRCSSLYAKTQLRTHRKSNTPIFKKEHISDCLRGPSYSSWIFQTLKIIDDQVTYLVRSLLFFLKVCKSLKFIILHLQSLKNFLHRIQMSSSGSWIKFELWW